MKLQRDELLKAIAFLKPAILVSDQPSPLEYVHVKTMGERCQLTAANHYFGKRATLFTPQQLEFEEREKEPDQEFMIDKPLLSKHKAAFSKAVKTDHTLNFIDIFPNRLESHKDVWEYNQPKLSYPDLDRYFVEGNYNIENFRFNPSYAVDVLKEFPGVVHTTFAESKEHPGFTERVYMQIESGEYQAFFCPIIPKGVK